MSRAISNFAIILERPDINADGCLRNVLLKHPSFEVVQVLDGDLRKENIATEFFEGGDVS
jgi:hypothetical protein